MTFPMLLIIASLSYSVKLKFENEYNLNSLAYLNLDLNSATNDFKFLIFHRFRFGFFVIKERYEIGIRIQAIDVISSTDSFNINNYHWGRELQHLKMDFTPFLELGYIRFNDIYDLPITLTIGRQTIKSSYILDDNSFGLNSLRLNANYPPEIKTEFIIGSYLPGINICSFSAEFERMKHSLTIRHLIENDGIGRTRMGIIFSKQRFYEFTIRREEEKFSYLLSIYHGMGERAFRQTGEKRISNFGCILNGGLKNENTPFGIVTLKAILGLGSGDNPESEEIDEWFSPTLIMKFDGVKRLGVGNFYSANLTDAFVLPAYCSGVGFAGFNLNIFLKRLFIFKFGYYSFFAQRGPGGGSCNLGTELDFEIGYKYLKEMDIKIGLSIFAPDKSSFGTDVSDITHFFLQVSGKV